MMHTELEKVIIQNALMTLKRCKENLSWQLTTIDHQIKIIEAALEREERQPSIHDLAL
jgi:hypothetical protein